MSRTVYLTGDDTITISQGSATRTLADFANGDIATITKPSENSTRTVGKGGNGIFARNFEGNAVDVDIRVLTSSADDKYFSALVTQYEQNPTRFVALNAVFSKASGDGTGVVSNKVYNCIFGVIKKQSDTKMNVSGDTEQAISTYRIEFIDSSVNFA